MELPPFFVLGALNEDQRCKVIGETTRKTGGKIGFIVDNRPRTIARYIAKITRDYPDVIVTKLGPCVGGFGLRAECHTQSKS